MEEAKREAEEEGVSRCGVALGGSEGSAVPVAVARSELLPLGEGREDCEGGGVAEHEGGGEAVGARLGKVDGERVPSPAGVLVTLPLSKGDAEPPPSPPPPLMLLFADHVGGTGVRVGISVPAADALPPTPEVADGCALRVCAAALAVPPPPAAPVTLAAPLPVCGAEAAPLALPPSCSKEAVAAPVGLELPL